MTLVAFRRSRPPVEPGQYTSIRYANRLLDVGALASIGSIGDSYDNAWPRPRSGSTRPNASLRGAVARHR